MIARDEKIRFYRCSVCGKIIVMVDPTMAPTICCGREMQEIVPRSVDASVEKHVPVVTEENGWIKVHVGSAEHPMDPVHYIQWIAVQTTDGFCIRWLEPGEKPEALFSIGKARVINVWEYCNLHGLWEA